MENGNSPLITLDNLNVFLSEVRKAYTHKNELHNVEESFSTAINKLDTSIKQLEEDAMKREELSVATREQILSVFNESL